jgi:ribosome-associated translation inhibitor RaiA
VRFSEKHSDEDDESYHFQNEEQDDPLTILKYFAEVLQKSRITPQIFFREADKDRDRSVTLKELATHVKYLFPNQFPAVHIQKLFNILDKNQDSTLREQEFLKMMQQAQDSHSDTAKYHDLTNPFSALKAGVVRKYIKGKISHNIRDQRRHILRRQTTTLEDENVGKDITEMVDPSYKMGVEEVIDYANDIIHIDASISDPYEVIKKIFDKVTRWKLDDNG